MTTPLDILYTPVDTIPMPPVDIQKLLNWIASVEGAEEQRLQYRKDASERVQNYPWQITYPRFDKKWLHEFDVEFPELAEYLLTAFPIDPNDVYSIILLPVKPEFGGLGFWHSDPDYGLRCYIENQETDDFLRIRPTKKAYVNRELDEKDIISKLDEIAQPQEFSAGLLSHNQAFYINNIRAVHAANVNKPGTLRIACIIYIRIEDGRRNSELEQMIVKSAENHPDYAIYWKPEDTQ